jgi:hypothetical protein
MCIGTIKGITNKSLRRFRGRIGMCLRRSTAVGLAGRMDAAWTQRGGVSGRICEQNQGLDALDALSVIPLCILLPLTIWFSIYCVHCIHRRGFAGLWVDGVRPLRVRVRPGAWEQIFRKACPRPVLPFPRAFGRGVPNRVSSPSSSSEPLPSAPALPPVCGPRRLTPDGRDRVRRAAPAALPGLLDSCPSLDRGRTAR